jgi:DNA topoisomerase VI subunit B
VTPLSQQGATLERTAFRTSRLLDFASEKELTAQIGHPRAVWPVVLLKELVDNALDAAEEAGVAPVIEVTLGEDRIVVQDNGPGIPPDVVQDVLDFAVRISSREAYVSPTRGAQGNALKVIVAIPFVLDGQSGRVVIEARGPRHVIDFGVDRIRQQPTISHATEPVRGAVPRSEAAMPASREPPVHPASHRVIRASQIASSASPTAR